MYLRTIFAAGFLLSANALAQDAIRDPVPMPYPSVEIVTSAGRIVVQLNRPRAPLTVDNFIAYVNDGAYDGTIFHRVIADFVIQGGTFDANYDARPERAPIPNESGNGLSNQPGTIAMARSEDPHSATRGWYINVADNERLDPTRRRWGYAVFGRVTEGMEVVERIAAIETGPGGPLDAEVPQTRVTIERMRILDE